MMTIVIVMIVMSVIIEMIVILRALQPYIFAPAKLNVDDDNDDNQYHHYHY